jgi:Rrf2 family protein
MFSRTVDHALRAVLLLAQRNGAGPLSAEAIAAALDAPRNYMSKTLHALVRDGILHSARGPHGGFTLAIPPDRLSVMDIMEVFSEVRVTSSTCVMANKPCNPNQPCAAHEHWLEVTQRARAPLLRTMISELCGAPQDPPIDAPVADHTGSMLVEAGRNPIPTGTKS